MSIAQTILNQLGGGQFVMMTGARKLVAGPNWLSFRIPFPKINAVQITLEGSDLYTVVFYYVRAGKIREVSRHEDIFNDQLSDLFRRETGLETRLPRVRFA